MRSAYITKVVRCVQSLRGWAAGCSMLNLSQKLCQKHDVQAEVRQDRTGNLSICPLVGAPANTNFLKGSFGTSALAGTAVLKVNSHAAGLPCAAAARPSQTCNHEGLLCLRTLSLSWKVEGSMLGKSFRATGSRNSMKGTTTKMMKGTRRNTSAVVRVSCRRSRLQAAAKKGHAVAAARGQHLVA